jgi:hypothetical protein
MMLHTNYVGKIGILYFRVLELKKGAKEFKQSFRTLAAVYDLSIQYLIASLLAVQRKSLGGYGTSLELES